MPLSLVAAASLALGVTLGASPTTPAPAQTTATEPERPLLPAPTRYRPSVDDPLLAPAPPASRQLKTWDEAWSTLTAQSPDLRSAQANVERAEGRWRQALGALLPNARATGQVAYDLLNPDSPAFAGGAGAGAVGAGGGVGAGVGVVDAGSRSPTVPLATATATVTQSLIDLGAWQGLAAARASTHSAEAGFQDTRRRLTQGLARALVAVVAAERVSELARLGLRFALERAELTTRTQQLGAATVLDVTRVRQDVEVARGELIWADEQLRRSREALGAALGLGEQVGVPPSFALDGLAREIRETCHPLPAAEARSDIIAAEKNLESARKSRKQASLGYLPSLGLSSTAFGYTTDPGPGRVAVWNIAAVLSFPLWEGGSRGGLVDERAGIEAQAREALVARRRDVSIEVSQARRSVEVARALREAAADARALAEKTDELTRRSFEVGRSGSIELVQSAAALRQADVALAAREFQLVQAGLDAFLTEAQCDD